MKASLIDIGGTSIKYAWGDGEKLYDFGEIPTPKQDIQALMNSLYSILDMLHTAEDKQCIGISATGLVDPQKGMVRNRTNTMPGYDNYPIRDLIAAKYGLPVCMHNDSNCAALGEAKYGAGRNLKDFICLTFGTGVGAGIFLNGDIYEGSRFFAGEVGHMVTHAGGRDCRCGNKGCYERYASVTALIDSVEDKISERLNGREIFSRLQNGDKKIYFLIDEWIDEIVIGIYTLVRIFDFRDIVLGGGIMQEQYLIDRIQDKLSYCLSSYSIVDCFKDTKVHKAQLGNKAGLYGAMAYCVFKLTHL
ncbi:MAG TPA: ROK family protein [Clostridiaceae bacterium]|nr:ROK family protein [Clostridiaceae bacterium]